MKLLIAIAQSDHSFVVLNNNTILQLCMFIVCLEQVIFLMINRRFYLETMDQKVER